MADLDDYSALCAKGAYREAYAVLRDMIKNQSCGSEIGNLYLRCAELELIVNNDLNRAQQLLDKAHELGSLDMALYYSTLGCVLWKAGERDRGKQYLEKSVALKPGISNLTTLGIILSYNDNKSASKIWKCLLEQDPNNCVAHVYLGIEAVKSGDREKALDMVKRAESLSPTIRDFFEIGHLYYDLGQFRNALDALFKAEGGNYEPEGSVYSAIAACYRSLGDNDTSIEYALRAIDLGFDDDYTKGILLKCMEEKESYNISDTFMEKHHDTCLVAILHAQEAAQEKEFSEAQALLSKAEQLEPSSLEMYYIGRQYHFMQCFDKALDTYLEAERMGYDLLYCSIALCYYWLDDNDSAFQYAIKALVINPADEDAKDVLYACREEVWGSEFGDNY